MKITKRRLVQIIKEEAADCVKDYMAMGYSRSEAYKECEDYPESGYGYGSRSRYRSSPRKTTYVGNEANEEKVKAVQAALDYKPNNFLKSILDQLKKGRGLSAKQKGIVRKILAKHDEESAKLFEGESKVKITKKQLRNIVRESVSPAPMKSRANPMIRQAVENSRQQERLRENQAFRHPKTGENMLLMINDLVNHLLDQGFDTLELAGELRGIADDVEDLGTEKELNFIDLQDPRA